MLSSHFRTKIRNSLNLEVGKIRQIPGGFLLALKRHDDKNALLDLHAAENDDVEVIVAKK